MSTIAYKVITGDTWAGISYKSYGTATAFPDILAANPAQPVDAPIPGSIILVPIQTATATVEANTSALPPWKR